MGMLVMRDLGAVSIKTSSGLIEVDNASSDGAFNPSEYTYPGQYNVVNLKAYTLSIEAGKSIDATPNIAGSITRLGIGGSNPIPITLNASFSRKRIEETSALAGGNQFTMEEANNITYLLQWSRTRSIQMLFWMPNEDDSSWLSYGQEKDFFTSQLRGLYDVLWDKNLGNSTTGWHDSTYGTYHYRVEMINIGNYDACAVPIVVESVSVKESADGIRKEVTIAGYIIENEEI